jgi:hypothetical protein
VQISNALLSASLRKLMQCSTVERVLLLHSQLSVLRELESGNLLPPVIVAVSRLPGALSPCTVGWLGVVSLAGRSHVCVRE